MTDYTQGLQLNTGASIPRLGFGTWQLSDSDAQTLVAEALKTGYRHIDTASGYQNEAGVGRGIADSGVNREDIFVTTKLANQDQGFENVKAAFQGSLDKLGLDYVDLYLIHWPLQDDDRMIRSWQALEEIHASGRAKAIGVSNFEARHLDLLAELTQTVPAVNQVEVHPGFVQRELRGVNAGRGIVTESWSPLGGTNSSGWGPNSKPNTLLGDPTIAGIAQAHGKSPAQVLIRWHLENDLVVLPKSSTAERIKQNFAVFDFELSDEEHAAITNLPETGRVGADPAEADFGAPASWR